MDQTVNIPFSFRLEPGDSSFQIDVSRSFLNNPNRLFSFQSVTVCPDYYSRHAFKLDMDSERELNEVVSNNFDLEIQIDKNLFHSTEETKAWGPTLSNVSMNALLKSLNTYFDTNKPPGFIFPAVVFDWFHLSSLSKKGEADTFHQSLAKDLYGEEYNASIHSNWLPAVYQEKTKLNNMIFPTKIKPELADSIRIRMTISPNVTVAFSNDDLPKALGFSDTQMPQKKNKQYQFVNDLTNSLLPITCFKSPTMLLQAITTKIHVYPTQTKIVSPMGVLKTTKKRERNPAHMVQDYNAVINKLAATLNLNFSLEHDVSNKKFKLVYPSATGVLINLRVPNYVGHRLGYGHVNIITPSMTNGSYPDEVPNDDVEKMARTLVYDTGMVVVSLGQRGSQQTQQFSTTYMATLEPEYSGVLTTKCTSDMPKVQVTYFNPSLEFVLSRFSENNEPTPLDWKVGSYVRGTLVGKV